MTVDEIRAELLPMLDKLDGLNARVCFEIKEGGALLLDARALEPTLRELVEGEAQPDCDCTLKMSEKNLLKLAKGELDPFIAFTTGRLKIKGSTGKALKLAEMISA